MKPSKRAKEKVPENARTQVDIPGHQRTFAVFTRTYADLQRTLAAAVRAAQDLTRSSYGVFPLAGREDAAVEAFVAVDDVRL